MHMSTLMVTIVNPVSGTVLHAGCPAGQTNADFAVKNPKTYTSFINSIRGLTISLYDVSYHHAAFILLKFLCLNYKFDPVRSYCTQLAIDNTNCVKRVNNCSTLLLCHKSVPNWHT